MNAEPRPTDRLRDALTTVADRHQADPGAWDAIADRARPGTPQLAEVTSAGAPHRRGRAVRLLAVAAVVAVLAAIGAAVVVAREDDTTDVATTPPATATGWYVPVGLPDGWKVRAVSVQRMDDDCPCRATTWADADRDVVVSAVSEPDTTSEDTTIVPSDHATTFELADGIGATLNVPEGGIGYWDVSWSDHGRYQTIWSIGVPAERAPELARLLYADPKTTSVPVDGIDLVEAWAEDGTVSKGADVEVAMEAPSGHRVDYTLASDHRFVSMVGTLVPTERVADQQPLPLLTPRQRGILPQGQAGRVRDYIGWWPGASVRVLGGFDGEAGATDAEIAAVAGALRPADLAEWRAFVATAGNRDRAATASATLADLIDGVTTATTATSTTAAGRVRTTTTTSATSTSTSALPAPGSVIDFAGLDLSLTAEPRLAAWEDAGVVLHVHNPTAKPITDPSCALDGAGIELVPADDATRASVIAIPAGEDQTWSDDGACDGGTTFEPGATKTIRLVMRAQFLDARYGPLPAGRYLATAKVFGVPQVTASVEIGGEDCPPDGTADYVGLTEAEARSLAGERLVAQVRIPPSGPESDVASQDCNRINLVVGDDGRVVYARAY